MASKLRRDRSVGANANALFGGCTPILILNAVAARHLPRGLASRVVPKRAHPRPVADIAIAKLVGFAVGIALALAFTLR